VAKTTAPSPAKWALTIVVTQALSACGRADVPAPGGPTAEASAVAQELVDGYHGVSTDPGGDACCRASRASVLPSPRSPTPSTGRGGGGDGRLSPSDPPAPTSIRAHEPFGFAGAMGTTAPVFPSTFTSFIPPVFGLRVMT
jgi:hypothetical protein